MQAPEWTDASYCTRCRTEFSTFNRKHHCRNCGHVFDQQCSAQSLPLPHFGVAEPVRVCDGCVKKLKDGTGAALARSTSLGAGGSAGTRLPERSQTVAYKGRSGRTSSEGGKRSTEDDDLAKAIAASLLDSGGSSTSGPAFQLRDPPAQKGYTPSYAPPVSSAPPQEEDDDPDLAAAIAASLRDVPAAPSGSAATYASLYPSTNAYPTTTPASAYPTLSAPPSHALSSYDLTPTESSSLHHFSSTLERPPPVLGSRERELYEDAQRAAPRLERGLEDAERRTEMLVEMNDKLGEATRLFEGLLDRRVREARLKNGALPSCAPGRRSELTLDLPREQSTRHSGRPHNRRRHSSTTPRQSRTRPHRRRTRPHHSRTRSSAPPTPTPPRPSPTPQHNHRSNTFHLSSTLSPRHHHSNSRRGTTSPRRSPRCRKDRSRSPPCRA